MFCGWVSFPSSSLFMLWLRRAVADLELCHVGLWDTSAYMHLTASLNSAVTSASLGVFQPRVVWLSLTWGGGCDDQSRKKRQQILSACHIKNSVHYVEVNLLCNHILLNLPSEIFLTLCSWWQIHAVNYTHWQLVYTLAKAQGNIEGPVITCLMLNTEKAPGRTRWTTKREWTFNSRCLLSTPACKCGSNNDLC